MLKLQPQENPYHGADFELARAFFVDSARINNNLRMLASSMNESRLNPLVNRRGMLGIIPATKMLFARHPTESRDETLKMLVRGYNELLDRFGPNFMHDVPGMNLSYPPYDKRALEVTRWILMGFFRACAPGKGGSYSRKYFNPKNPKAEPIQVKNQEYDVLFSNGRNARSIEEFQRNVILDGREYCKKHPYQEPSARHTAFQLPYPEQVEFIWPEDRQSNFVFMWLDRFLPAHGLKEHSKTKIPEKPQELHTEREYRLIHFSTKSELPRFYEDVRAGKQPQANCVSEFEDYFNKELAKLYEEGWELDHYNLAYKHNLAVQEKNSDTSSEPKNHFFVPVRLKKVEDPAKRAFKQIRLAVDHLPLRDALPNQETQQRLAEPLSRLARDPNEPCKDWYTTTVTWGYFPHGFGNEPGVRLMHSIALTRPSPEQDQKEMSRLKNLRFFSSVFRGPKGQYDPSQIKAKIYVKWLEDKDRLDKKRLRYIKDRSKDKELEQEEKALLARMLDPKFHLEDIRHFEFNKNVHDLEWMIAGCMGDLISRQWGAFKAAVHVRDYIGENFLEDGSQGFNVALFNWVDISRPGLYKLDT